MKRQAAAWAKQHGDTVKVVDESTNPGGYQFYATAARAGQGPDIAFGIGHDNNSTFVQEGLDEPVPSSVINPHDYAKSTMDAVTINGKVYSVPFVLYTTALFYNTNKIKTPPKTWSQFVNDANKYGFGFRQEDLYHTFAFVGGYGGYVFKNNHGTLDPNNIGLANAGAVQAYSLLHQMDAKYHWMTPSVKGGVPKSEFVSGKTGMFIGGNWDISSIKQAKIHFSVAPLPTLPNGKVATPFMSVIDAFVNARSPQNLRPAEWSLLQAITNAPTQIAFAKASQQLPTLINAQNVPAIQKDPVIKGFVDQLKTAVPMPGIPQMIAVWNSDGVVLNIISGKVSPEQGAKDFVKSIKDAILVQG